MAKSASTVYGFSFERSLSGVDQPIALWYIIKDSQTVTIGDPVRFSTDGYLKRAAAGEAVLGIVQGLGDKDGLTLFENRSTGLTGATLSPDDTVAVSSTNSSDSTRNLKAAVLMDPAGLILYKNKTDGTLTATNLGQLFDVGGTVGQIATGTASDSNGQFQLITIDDNDSTVGYFRLVESQLAVGIDQGTAKITA